jgi:ferrous iron transport protein B
MGKCFTEQLDSVALDRRWGLPFFLVSMAAVFSLAMGIGVFLEPFFEQVFSAIFIDGTAKVLSLCHASDWLSALLVGGVGSGLNITLTFIPVLGAMFFSLAFLEASGYMARASLVMDRFMRFLGLPGKAFVPLVVGFGCNVPGIIATRTLEDRRDRILSVMMSPFMSCGARLAIFAIFANAFFKEWAGLLLFALYVIGIAMAILTGFLLKKTVLRGGVAPLAVDLPSYKLPNFWYLLRRSYISLKGFVLKAGKLIIPLCVLIGTLNSISISGEFLEGAQTEQAALAVVGRSLSPVFKPMGITEENWPATVGLLTGLLAKEVVVGTLNALYSQEAGVGTNEEVMSAGAFVLMNQRFDGKVGAFAYLLFILLYVPCISATAAMKREVQWGWTFFSLGWTSLLAYSTAVIFYQTATLAQHPLSSLCWITSMFMALGFAIYWVKRVGNYREAKLVPTKIIISAGTG